MDCFAVIATYNGEKWIEKCLGSMLQDVPPDHIIVVDNHSADRTVHIIQQLFPEVLLIRNVENAGFGGANNIGIRKALALGASYVFLLNQDAYIAPGAITGLARSLSQHADYGILSPVHFNGDGSALDHGFKYYVARAYALSLANELEQGDKGEEEIYPLPFVNAAAWMLSKECIEKVGLFHPAFFHYGEDMNYCNRVLFHGYKIGVSPSAKIYHDRTGPETFDKKEALRAISIVPLNAVLDLKAKPLRKAYLAAARKTAELGYEGIKLLSPVICWRAIAQWLTLIGKVKKISKIRQQTGQPYFMQRNDIYNKNNIYE